MKIKNLFRKWSTKLSDKTVTLAMTYISTYPGSLFTNIGIKIADLIVMSSVLTSQTSARLQLSHYETLITSTPTG